MNLTISLDEHIIKMARVRAIQDGVSLSAKVRELLDRYSRGQLDSASAPIDFATLAVQASVTNAAMSPAESTPSTGSVPAEELRQARGWAREDLYDRGQNAPAPPAQ